MKPIQSSLFPKEYYIGKILSECNESERIKNVVRIGDIIKITPLLDEFKRRVKL